MTIFSKNSHCDLDPIILKYKLDRGVVIPNTCVTLYQNWIINEVAIAMTKHTYIHSMYVSTGKSI